nr:EOG090X0H1B [Sida crystallina]
MPSKKKKYNARFPPVSKLFVESLLTKAVQITSARNAKTLSPAHLKQCILAENRFDFLKDLVLSIPDVQGDGEDGTTSIPATPISLHAPPVFRSQSVSTEEAASSSRGGRRPRGRPRKHPIVVQRSMSTKSGKSATESDESDSGESEGSDDDEEISTDTDSLAKGSRRVPASKNGDVTQAANPQSTLQFNAVQPNFYQEINNTQAPFQIQINLPPHDAAVGNGQINKETTAEDDDYDT